MNMGNKTTKIKFLRSKVLIRKMDTGDIEAVSHVASTSFLTGDRQHNDPMFREKGDEFRCWEMSKSLAKKKDLVGKLVADVNGSITGVVSYGVNEIMPGVKIGEIGYFAVSREYQGLGIGRKLITSVREKFLEQGLTFGRVHTDASSFMAIKVYESIGLKIYDLEMVYTISSTEYKLNGEKIVLKKAQPAQTNLIQKIDISSFEPYEFFIHKEFLLQEYNKYLKEKLVSKKRQTYLNKEIKTFLIGYKKNKPVGYCRIIPKREFSEFFKKEIVGLEIKVIRVDDIRDFLAAAVQKLENKGIDIVDILIRFLDQPLLDAIQDLGFRLVHCPIWMGGKIAR